MLLRLEDAKRQGETVDETIITDGSQLVNGKLRPNVTYKTGEYGYIYQTNENGLIVSVRAQSLQLKSHLRRLRHNAKTVGKRIGDQAGHLIADLFGGSPKLDNLVSQAKGVNQIEYRAFERECANALKKGYKVSVDLEILYNENDPRPVAFNVKYTINDELFSRNIMN